MVVTSVKEEELRLAFTCLAPAQIVSNFQSSDYMLISHNFPFLQI